MAFTIDALAAELGIDAETLKSKPDAVAKWNGYLSEADTKYRDAAAAVEKAKRDQDAIDEQITKFGLTEARVAELETRNAALSAAIEQAKKSGLNIDLNGIPNPTKSEPADPVKTVDQLMRSNFANMGAAMQVQTTYQAVYGKPYADDPVKLIDEAAAARMPVAQYAEQKYKFAEERQKQAAADMQRKIDEGVQAGVKKWQEEHPVTKGHEGLNAGLASKHPRVFQPRSRDDQKSFRSLPAKERLAASVARVRQSIAESGE